jgi:hypothetical protein
MVWQISGNVPQVSVFFVLCFCLCWTHNITNWLRKNLIKRRELNTLESLSSLAASKVQHKDYVFLTSLDAHKHDLYRSAMNNRIVFRFTATHARDHRFGVQPSGDCNRFGRLKHTMLRHDVAPKLQDSLADSNLGEMKRFLNKKFWEALIGYFPFTTY